MALMWLAMFMLVLGLSCKLFPWGYCQLTILPQMSIISRSGEDFASIGIPLLMLILGLSLQIFRPFGWWVSLGSFAFLFFFFGVQSLGIWRKIIFEKKVLIAQSETSSYPLSILNESLISNFFILILCTFAFVYFILPNVKRLYFS